MPHHSAPNHRSFVRLASLTISCAVLLAASSTRAILIDDFGSDSLPSSTSRSITGGNPIGGELDYFDRFSSRFGESNGNGIVGKRPGPPASATLVYDGLDDSSADAFGLGGLDITGGGSADAFAFEIDSVRISITLVIWVMESPNDYARSQSIAIDSAGTLIVPFSVLDSIGAGADFTSVEQLRFDFLDIDSGDGLMIASITTIPEPGTAILLGFGLMAARTLRLRPVRG